MSIRKVIARSDEWSEVSTDHLDARRRQEGNEMKELLIGAQKGRTFIRAPYETGECSPRSYVINDIQKFKQYLNEALEMAELKPMTVALETKGSTNLWVKSRKRIDGDEYYKNDESSGVTVILMNILVREGENKPAFIDVKSIVDNDLDGEPSLPDEFYKLLRHRQVMIVGECVAKHIRRIENSFYSRINKILYTTVEDITDRVVRHKREYNKNLYDVHIDPNRNSGFIQNFHEIFPNHTYFKNPYEVLADWSDISELRESQLKHALNKIWFVGLVVEKALSYFAPWNLSFSIMGSLFPNCREEVRVDFRLKNLIDYNEEPPKWYNEILWPCGPMQSIGQGDLSRTAVMGDADQVRLDQEEEEKDRRRSHTKSDQRKRKRLTSDVSEDEDADHAHLTKKIAETKTKRRGEKAARYLKLNASRENMDALLKTDDHDDVLFVSTVIQNMGDVAGKKNIKAILDFYGESCRWPGDRKERLVNTLARDGFFSKSKASSPYIAMTHLRIPAPTVTFLLQMNVLGDRIVEYVRQLNQNAVRDIIDGLEAYMALPLDERKIQLESAPFYSRERFYEYLRDDNKVMNWILVICDKCNMAPGDAFFRHRRPGYIHETIESGRQGFISSPNAALMVARHVGDDYDDKKDAVLMAARWPALAESLSSYWGLRHSVRRVSRCDPNLKKDVECRRNFHAEQTETEISFIRDSREIADMKATLAREELLVLTVSENKDPRSFDRNPSLAIFTAPGRDTFAFFPHDLEDDRRDEIYGFLRSKILCLQAPERAKKWLLSQGDTWRIVNLSGLMEKLKLGRATDSFSLHVWGSRFCIINKDEWMMDPLTDSQKYHVAYATNMLVALVGKIGLDVVMQNIKTEKLRDDNNAIEFRKPNST